MDSLKQLLSEKSTEHQVLKSLNEELKTQISSLHEVLQQKENEIHKFLFEKERLNKAEDDFRKKTEEFRHKENTLLREIQDLREKGDIVISEKAHMSKALVDAKNIIDKLQRNLMSKDDLLKNLYQVNRSPERDQKIETSPKKFDIKRLKIPQWSGTFSPGRRDVHTERDDSYKQICQEAMKIVEATSYRELCPKIAHLKNSHAKYKKSKTLVDRISSMILQCTPEGAFKAKPKIREIWKWITRILEEYMKIKQSVSGGAFTKMAEMLNADSPEDMLEKISQLLRARNKYNS